MTKYNWDELELKYFGPDYKTLTPYEKMKITIDKIFLVSQAEKPMFEKGILNIDDETRINLYRTLISAVEENPEIIKEAAKMLKYRREKFIDDYVAQENKNK